LEVEVVPEAMAENESVGAGRFGGRKLLAEAIHFVIWDREADHQFDWSLVSVKGIGREKRKGRFYS